MASRIQFSSLRSKVGRRFFYLFVVCAILPLTILALISYYQVSGQLRDQATQRLEQLSKNQGMVIYERLLHLQKELERTGRDNHQETPSDSPSLWKKGFDSISLLNQIGVTPLIGEPLMPPILSGKQKMALAAEKAILFQGNASQETPGIFMAVASGPGSILIGEINTDYLWGQGPLNELPFSTELTILDEDNRVLFSSVGAPFELLDKVQKGSAGSFQWKFQEGSYIAGLWPLFIKGNFHPPQWIIVLSQPESKVFGPMNEFMKLFPPVVLTTFWTVLLVSMIFIRKHLTPLEKLKAGTKEIARRDFQARIDVQSNDEFQE
ncbi:MAG: HAMP domain-containing protein, partial [Desulfovibrionales bacterium]